MDFKKVMRLLQDFFEEQEMETALIGGFALAAHGIPRATVDLDFLAEEACQGRIVRFLESLGYETLSRSRALSNHDHPMPSLGRVDFLYVGRETAEEIFRQGIRVPILTDRTILVAKPEHLVALKLFAKAANPGRFYREMEDIGQLCRLDGIDHEEVRGYFEKYGCLEEYEKLTQGGG